MVIFVCITVGFFIPTIIQVCKISDTYYEEQNAVLEENISNIVLQYEEFEKETFKDTKLDTGNAKFIAFAETYPELKSNKIVQEQISTLKENNKEILKLKSKKANIKSAKFKLYFGH